MKYENPGLLLLLTRFFSAFISNISFSVNSSLTLKSPLSPFGIFIYSSVSIVPVLWILFSFNDTSPAFTFFLFAICLSFARTPFPTLLAFILRLPPADILVALSEPTFHVISSFIITFPLSLLWLYICPL